MMKLINNIIGLLCFLFAVTSCVEDNTADSFKTLNYVTIDSLEWKYSVMLYDTLKINPIITTYNNDDSKLLYMWYAYTAVTSGEADTLSYEKNLNVMADPSILTPGEDYTLILRVVDGETGVFYQKSMKLEVTTQFTKGTIFLCEENGEPELNFMQDNDEKTFLEKVYEGANKELVGKNPLKIISLNPSKYAPFMKQEYIWCKDENGGIVASPLSFEKVNTMREVFDVTPTADILSPEYYFKGKQIEYIIVNGMLHKRATNMKAVTWEPALVLMNTPYEYSIASDVLFSTGTPVFFDELHGRLITHATWNKAALKVVTKSPTDPNIFDPNNVGKNFKLKCCGHLSEPKMGAWMLLENTNDHSLWIYKFSMLGDLFSSISKTKITEIIAPNMKNAIGFAANQNSNDILVYATQTGIYSMSVNQLKDETSSCLEVLQVDTSLENMEVTGLEFLNITVSAENPEYPSATRISPQVRVYVRDLTLPEKQGGVVFYEVGTIGGVHLEQIFKKTGFCDRVIDIDEKYN